MNIMTFLGINELTCVRRSNGIACMVVDVMAVVGYDYKDIWLHGDSYAMTCGGYTYNDSVWLYM